MSREQSSQRVHRTEPVTKLYPWQSAPSTLDQALEAANDDPSITQLVGMLCDLECLYGVGVDGEDDEWRPTTISVNFDDRHGSGTSDVIKIMRRAGWEPVSTCFSRNRITFEEVES